MATGLRYWVYGVKVRGLPWYRVTDAFESSTPCGFFHVIRYGDIKEIAVLSLRKPKIGTFFNPTRELWSVLEPGYLKAQEEHKFWMAFDAGLATMSTEWDKFQQLTISTIDEKFYSRPWQNDKDAQLQAQLADG